MPGKSLRAVDNSTANKRAWSGFFRGWLDLSGIRFRDLNLLLQAAAVATDMPAGYTGLQGVIGVLCAVGGVLEGVALHSVNTCATHGHGQDRRVVGD